MAIQFLECEYFKQPPIRLRCPCCHNCHKLLQNRIHVRPYKEDGLNADHELCIEAIVCCSIYDFVRALPREWWIEQAKAFGVYKSRDDGRGYMFTDHPEKNTERRSDGKKATSFKQKIKAIPQDEETIETEEGLAYYLSKRRL